MKGHYGMKIQVRVGGSRIAGKGVFAAQFIKKDTWVLEYTGEKISRQEATERLA
jgi:SET domain-containing protein